MEEVAQFRSVRKRRNKGAQKAPAEKAIPRKFRRAIREGDAEGLSALIRGNLADLPAEVPLWGQLAGLFKAQQPKDMAYGLSVCLAAVLDDNDLAALRALVRTAQMPDKSDEDLKAWQALRDVLAGEGEAAQSRLRAACQWFLTAPIAKRRTTLRLRVVEWLAKDAPDDAAAQWEMVRELAKNGEAGAVWPHFDRLLAARIAPPADDLRLLVALAGQPKEEILARLPLLGRKGWSRFRMKLVNAAARHLDATQGDLRRPLVTRNKLPILVSEDGGVGITAIVFNGRDRMPGAPFAQFDAVLAQRGIRTIHLFDEQKTAYISGAAGQPTIAASFDLLRRVVDETPGNRVITIGNSMSAIAACAYGLNLRVDGVIGLAAATTGQAAERARIGDKRGSDFAAMAEGLAGAETDLRTWYDRIPHRPIVHLHFASGMAIDKAHAERLAEYEGVTLFEVAGHHVHSLPAEMMLRGSLGAAIDQMIMALNAKATRPRA